MKTNRLTFSRFFILMLSLLLISQAFAQESSSDSSNIDYNEGPHVYWQNDSTINVLYYCSDSLIINSLAYSNSLEFSGLCNDSHVMYKIASNYTQYPSYRLGSVPRIFAVSDLHGEFEYFEELLVNAKIIDKDRHWIYGDGHLIIVGDVFDRGDKVTECLWLIYLLEQEAIKAGGQVHLLLGNHEIMVLRGDDRYIHEKYLQGISRKSRIEHRDLFGRDMELGRWLRTKPAALVINDVLFTHGGIAPYYAQNSFNLDSLNRLAANCIDISSAEKAFDDEKNHFLRSLGPYWYRGYQMSIESRYPETTPDEMTSILDYYKVHTIVVGHSENDSIMTFQNNRVIGIDVPVFDLDGLHGLLIEDGKFFIVNQQGKTSLLK
ncbi:MAG: metallophosphoesterase [candidate division Zixibacteria bacterium]|nr:metallophosphoesterase [candidate division Zixibacteria bacterium]